MEEKVAFVTKVDQKHFLNVYEKQSSFKNKYEKTLQKG